MKPSELVFLIEFSVTTTKVYSPLAYIGVPLQMYHSNYSYLLPTVYYKYA